MLIDRDVIIKIDHQNIVNVMNKGESNNPKASRAIQYLLEVLPMAKVNWVKRTDKDIKLVDQLGRSEDRYKWGERLRPRDSKI